MTVAGLRQIGWVMFAADGGVFDFTDDRSTFPDDAQCEPVFVAEAVGVKSPATPTESNATPCPMCKVVHGVTDTCVFDTPLFHEHVERQGGGNWPEADAPAGPSVGSD